MRIACSSSRSSGPGSRPSSLVEARAEVPVGGERVRLAAEPVEREHLLAAQALAQRVLGDQRLELARERRVLAAREVGLDALLERQDAQLLEAPHLALRERLIAELAQDRAAPQRERLAERLRRLGRAAGREQRAAVLVAAREALGVELVRLDVEPVAARLGAQRDRRAGRDRAGRARP